MVEATPLFSRLMVKSCATTAGIEEKTLMRSFMGYRRTSELLPGRLQIEPFYLTDS